jgi:uncharacterized protein
MDDTMVGRPNPPKFGIRRITGIRIPSSVPGKTLGADLYLPRTTDPVPAVVTMHSLRKDALGGLGHRRHLKYFAGQGYGALYVDCFGVGASDGTPRPLLAPGEVDDGESVVEWVSGQRWCNGQVALWGGSHGAMITLAVAARAPRALTAICPVMGLTDPERDFIHPAGVRGGVGTFFGMSTGYNILCALVPPLHAEEIEQRQSRWRERLDHFEPWFLDGWRHPPGDPTWRERRVDVSKIEVPAFCVTGWRDVFCDPMVRAYQEIPAPKALLVGPWLHMFPDAAPVEPVASTVLACRWFDRWVKGKGNEPERVVVHIGGSGARWGQVQSWPAETARRTFLPSLGGVLDDHESPTVATMTVLTDATVGVLNGVSDLPQSPVDHHDDDIRSMAFTSGPLAESALVFGRPQATLALDPANTVERCVLRLSDVDDEGRSVPISDGLVNLGASHSATVVVPLKPACYSIAAGHRIRLSLADADFPLLWPADLPAELSVRAGGPTRLELPLADPADLAGVSPVRPDTEAGHPTRRPVPPPSWEVLRDLHRGSARVSYQRTETAPVLRHPDRFFEREVKVKAEVNSNDPARATMSAAESFAVETEAGDQVLARSEIEMRTDEASVFAEVVINDRVAFAKNWKMR